MPNVVLLPLMLVARRNSLDALFPLGIRGSSTPTFHESLKFSKAKPQVLSAVVTFLASSTDLDRT